MARGPVLAKPKMSRGTGFAFFRPRAFAPSAPSEDVFDEREMVPTPRPYGLPVAMERVYVSYGCLQCAQRSCLSSQRESESESESERVRVRE